MPHLRTQNTSRRLLPQIAVLGMLLTACGLFNSPPTPKDSTTPGATRPAQAGLNSHYRTADGKTILTGLSPTIDLGAFQQYPDAVEAGWYGYLTPEITDTYRFSGLTSAGGYVWLDGQAVQENQAIVLVKGRTYPIRIKVGLAAGRSGSLQWKGISTTAQPIPGRVLSPSTAALSLGTPLPTAPPLDVLNATFDQRSGLSFQATWVAGLGGFQEGINSTVLSSDDPYWKDADFAGALSSDTHAGAGALKLLPKQEYNLYTSEVDVMQAGSVIQGGGTYEVSGYVKGTGCSVQLVEPALEVGAGTNSPAQYTRVANSFTHSGKPTNLNVRLSNTGTGTCLFDDVKIVWTQVTGNLPQAVYNVNYNGSFDLDSASIPYWTVQNGTFNPQTMTVSPGYDGTGRALGLENAVGKLSVTQRLSVAELLPSTRYILKAWFRAQASTCLIVVRSARERSILSSVGATETPAWQQMGTYYTTPATLEDLDIEVVASTEAAPGTCAIDNVTFGPLQVAGNLPSTPPDPDFGPRPILAEIDPEVTPPAAFADEEVDFSASDVSDTAQYLWSFGDGSETLGPQATHTYKMPGQYTVRLQVTDGTGLVTSKTSALSVMPSIDQLASERVVVPGRPVILDVKYPAAGLVYEWTLEQNQKVSGPRTEAAFETLGFHDVKLTIYDKRSGVDLNGVPEILIERETHVNAVIQRPQAKITANDRGNFNIGFSAAQSFVDPHTNLSYAWDFGDGSTGQGVSASHTYTETGRFAVTLKVTDTYGQVDESHMIVLTYVQPTSGPENYIQHKFGSEFLFGLSVSDQAGTGDPAIRAAFQEASDRSANSLVVSRRSTPAKGLVQQSLMSETDHIDVFHPYVLPEKTGSFYLASASSFKELDTSVTVNGSSVPRYDGWDLAHWDEASASYEHLTGDTALYNRLRAGENEVVLFPGLVRSAGGSTSAPRTATFNIPAFSGLRVPHINLNIIPDAQLEDTSIREYSFDNNGQEELMAVVNVRASEVSSNGYVPMTVPVYAVDEQGKLLNNLNGNIMLKFNDPRLSSHSREGVMVRGRTEILVYVPIAQFSDGAATFNLTDLVITADASCSPVWNNDYAHAGHWVYGCAKLKATHATPLGAVDPLPVSAQGLQAQGLTAQWTMADVKRWTGKVNVKLLNAVNYGKTAISRLRMDKLLASYEGSVVGIAVGIVPILGDSVDLLVETMNAATGKGVDPIVVALASIGLALDLGTGGLADITAPLKAIYKFSKGSGGAIYSSIADTIMFLKTNKYTARQSIEYMSKEIGFFAKVALTGSFKHMGNVDKVLKWMSSGSICRLSSLTLQAQGCNYRDVRYKLSSLYSVFSSPELVARGVGRQNFISFMYRACCVAVNGIEVSRDSIVAFGEKTFLSGGVYSILKTAFDGRASWFNTWGIFNHIKFLDTLRVGSKDIRRIDVEVTFPVNGTTYPADIIATNQDGSIRMIEAKSGSVNQAQLLNLIAAAKLIGARAQIVVNKLPNIMLVCQKLAQGIDVLNPSDMKPYLLKIETGPNTYARYNPANAEECYKDIVKLRKYGW